MANISQTHFRFGKEELLEATHGWWQAEDVNHSQEITADWAFLLRFCEQEITGGAAANTDAQFQYNKNGAGWNDITTTSSVVKAVASVAFTNGQACTKRLSGTGTFETSGAGCTEDGSSGGPANDIAASGNSETEAGLQVVYADVASNDTIQFRFTSPDWPSMTYAVTPTLTVTFAPVVVTPTPISSIAAVVDPTVVIEGGGVTVTPDPITAVASKAEPAVVLGSISITPSVLTAVASLANPTVVLGSISVTPAVISAVSQKVDPTVVLGSLTITPAVITTVAAVVDPTIPTGITVTPDALSAVSSNADPSVVLGSISLTADALAIIAAKGDPTVVINTNITPAGLDSVGDRVAPTVVLGSLSVVPIAGFGVADRFNPDVILGSIILIPSPLAIVSDRATPTVVLGSLIVSNPISSAVSATKGFTYEIAGKRKVKFAKL